MRWSGRRESQNVEDRRGISPGGMAAGGGLGTLVLVIVALLFGADPRLLLEGVPTEPTPATSPARPANPAEEELKRFTSVVLADTEDVWKEIFRREGIRYREPALVLFNGQVRSACGAAGATVGPFYCPGDQKVYLDLSFFRDLDKRFGAPGDFAQAYVIAHEVGHHVQNLLGTSDKVHQLQQRTSQPSANRLSVRLELQADFYAGMWARYAQQKGLLDPGDIEEALRAATAIGDDRLQQKAQGYAVPDSFTHGTSEQRVRWFRRGLETGDLRQGDTFKVRSL